MLLNKLELLGFKSFPQRLKIEFGSGITCIVGPNGCGKTNIADAIRWALGEQSAKALRGGSMGDVIFNGTANRKPIGMAEVTLTFSNSGSLLPLEYDEIAVNRRVFRSGVSEYSLNKTPCRLKDIKDVFFDTGIGSHAYSLIEQEMVDHVLSDNSGHRRFLFEEAAGIMKYKTRKREALLKLEATESDLLRVNDILIEIEREANSLRRQIAKARRFKRLEAEVKELDVSLAALSYSRYDEEVRKLSLEQQSCLAKKGQVSGVVSSLEAALEKLKLQIVEEEERVTAAASEVAEVEERQAETKDRILVLRERRNALDSKCLGLTEDMRHIEERTETAERRSKETAEELRHLEDSLAARTEEMRSKTGELALIERDLLAAKAELQALNEHVSDARAEETQRASKLDELSAMKEELQTQLAAMGEETQRLESKLAELRRAREARNRELDERKRRLAGLQTAMSETLEQQKSLQQAGDDLLNEEASLTGEAKALEGRLGALETLLAGQRKRRETIRETLGSVTGKVTGMLEDLVQIPSELAAAFDAILSEYGSVVVVDNRETALACFAALDAKSVGRFSVLTLDEADETPSHAAPSSVLSSPGVVGEAAALLSCPEKLRGAVRSLLQGTVILEKEETLRDEKVYRERTARFVTRDGRFVCRGRVLTGGKESHSAGLEVESQLAEGRARLERARTMLKDCESRGMSLRKERDEARERGERLSRELAELRIGASADERALYVCDAESKILEDQLVPAREKRKNLEERLQAYAKQVEDLETEISRLRTSPDPRREKFDAQSSLVNTLSEKRESALSGLGELRMTDVRERARQNELQSLARRLEEEKQVLASELARKRVSLEEAKSTREQGDEQLADLEQRASELAEVDRERVGKLESARASFNLLRKEASGLEEKTRAERRVMEQLSEEAHNLELGLTRQKIEREGEVRRIHAEYETDLTVVAPPPETFDAAQAQEKLTVAREKIRGLGPVNLLALEDFEKKKERLDFIRHQRDDLLEAKSSLLEVIEKINERASTLFLETFNSVQQKFRETFKTLFEGGDAELRLLGEDPLEGEIEVVARPRGKSLQSLNLLSGGERALTAIALLFAIYLVKPSPFCILDEVDAPLDDANIHRFLGMLKTFNKKTQFIVITHNKRTMEAADYLYGITMQEPGVSKVVSVRLTDAGEPEEVVEEAVAVES
ncbi:MAG: chromosome segregation protein SMC [Candidatus Eiseniibacteriota bacterium]|nr:MAG: chromosome segregation protein SMC [Candidatus Eisenbacteria bacterium]